VAGRLLFRLRWCLKWTLLLVVSPTPTAIAAPAPTATAAVAPAAVVTAAPAAAIAAPTAVIAAAPAAVTAAPAAVTAASMTGRDDMGDRRRLRRSGIGCSRRRRGDSYRGSPCRQYRCEVVQSDSHGRTPSIVQFGLIPELPSCERMSLPLAPIPASPAS
jgi:hypothetical protein